MSAGLVGKPTLAMDLDETLVHRLGGGIFDGIRMGDFTVEVPHEGHIHRIKIIKRPGLEQFLQRASQKYDLVLFIAGTREYALAVLENIDPNGYISRLRVFSRNQCTKRPGDNGYYKNLTQVAPLDNVILLENDPRCYELQPQNGLPISNWFGGPDGDLGKIAKLLEHIAADGSSTTSALAALDQRLGWDRAGKAQKIRAQMTK